MRNPLLALTLALALAVPPIAMAEFDGPGYGEKQQSGEHQQRKHQKRGKMHEKLKNMTQEERQAFKKDVKQKWDALSEEEKAAFKVKAEEMMEAQKKAREERRLIRLYGLYLLKQQEGNQGE